MNSKNLRREKGVVLVETALVLPLFMVLLMGIFEVGRMLMVKQAITNAAREGARTGAIYLDDTQALSAAMLVSEDYLNRTGIDPSQATISPVFSQVDGATAVQVTIDYDFASQLFHWVPGIPETVELNTQVIMRREG